MSRSNGLSFLRRFFLKSKASPRRGKPRSRFMPEFLHLEDRCVPSYVVPLPQKGNVQLDSSTLPKVLSSLFYAPATPSQPTSTSLTPKLVTIMNNSTNLVYPILYDSNVAKDLTQGTIVRVELTDPGEGYTGPVTVGFDGGTGSGASATVNVVNSRDGTVLGILDDVALTGGGSGYNAGQSVNLTFTGTHDPTKREAKGKAIVSASNGFTDAPGAGPSKYDSIDGYRQTYRGYIGERNSAGNYELGLKPGDQVTVQLPPVFWDSGRLYFATNGPVPLSSATDPGNPLQNINPWLYNDTTNTSVVQSYVVAPSDTPADYSANFKDPATNYANANGVVMWYHDPAKAIDLGFGAPAQLTEWTFRDPHLAVHPGPNGKLLAPDTAQSEIKKLVNYDVSYVDNLSMSASMEATKADIPGQFQRPVGTGNLAWTGADLTDSQMQQFIESFTTNNTAIGTATDKNVNGLGTYFGGLGWDQYYLPPDNSPTGQIIDINNANGQNIIITQSGSNALQPNQQIKIDGVTGTTASLLNGKTFTVLSIDGGTFRINQKGDGNRLTGGSYVAQTTGIHLLKIPSGYQALADAPNGDHVSTYNANQFTLASGGAVDQVDTQSTGIVTKGSKEITNVSAAQIAKLVPGMLWRADEDPVSHTKYFPTGTFLASVSGTTITMSQAAQVDGPSQSDTASPPHPAGRISWTFVGSQYTSATGSTDGTHTYIDGIDANVGMYLRPRMLVRGGGLPSAYVGSVTNNFTRVNLVDKDGNALNPVPAAGKGPYSFTGAPDSYIVQTLVNNWYAWSDYYVRNQENPLPAGGVTSTTGNTYGSQNSAQYPDGRKNPKSLILYNIDPTVFKKLHVGDVVTGPGLTVNDTLNKATYDPSLNYTIAQLNPKGEPANSVELTLPTAGAAASGAYAFTSPQYVLRSSEAPMVPTTDIGSITNGDSSPVTITTGTSAGLANGVLITITKVTGGQTGINGSWIVTNLAASGPTGATFQLKDPTTGTVLLGNGKASMNGQWSPAPFAGATTVPTKSYTLNFTSGQAEARQFATPLYDVMQNMSLLTGANPDTNLSKATQLITEIIGGNVGNFQAYNDLFEKKTHRPTTLPHARTNEDLRDEIKSLLRGIYDFVKAPDQSKWYPDPAKATPGATLDQGSGAQPVTFGIYNLDPYVWFVHVQLQQNGYGFSLDDDVANSSAIANSLQIAFGGNEYTAPLTNDQTRRSKLENLEAFTGGAPFGTVKYNPDVPMASIDVTSQNGKDYQAKNRTMIAGLSEAVVGQLIASDKAGDPLGAYITTGGKYPDSLLPRGVTVNLAQPIAPGSGPSFVTFKNPEGWKPPTTNGAVSYYTFSGFTTVLPSNIAPPDPPSGKADTPVTITGNGFTGVISVTFNTMDAAIVQGTTTAIDNTAGNPVKITTLTTQAVKKGLVNGDTVTISGVTDETAKLPASINGTWKVTNLTLGDPTTTFQLQKVDGTTVTGDGHTLSQKASWIDGSDRIVKVIIPTPKEIPGTTYPGRVGKIGVKTPSGTDYSTNDFTITTSSTGPQFTGIAITGQSSGLTAHGPLTSRVTLFGSGFTNATDVTFKGGSGTILPGFQINPAGTELTVTIPEGATGTGSFTVTAGGITKDSGTITFQVDLPTLNSNPFDPTSGPIASTFTISGNNFFGAAEFSKGGGVLFGTTAATTVQVNSNTQLLVTVPAGLSKGPVQVSVKTSAGTSGSSTFNVTSATTPSLTSATPNSAAVGAMITLAGQNFTGVDQPGGGVTFNGVAATKFTVDSSGTTITVFVPDGATTGNIVVTNAGGSSNGLPFTVGVAGPPTITSFTPTSGAVNTQVTITGSNFTKVDDVEFGPGPISVRAGFDIRNDATIIATVPARAKRGPILIHNNLGWATSTTEFNPDDQTVIILVKAGSPQTATVNTAFGKALEAKVTDSSGKSVGPGLTVIFTAPLDDASGTFASNKSTSEDVLTDNDGVAKSSIFTANGTAGSFDVTASIANEEVKFKLTNVAASATTVAFAVSAVDGQIYKQAIDTNGKPQPAWTLTAPGEFTAVAVGTWGAAAAPIAFGVGKFDQDVYVARFTVGGDLVDGWGKPALGDFTSIVVGAVGSGGTTPILFGIGAADKKAYAAVYNAEGKLDHGWFKVDDTRTFASLTVGQYGVDGNPELFAVGSADRQVYAARFDAKGKPVGGFFNVAPGLMSSVTVAGRGNGTQELFGLGVNQRISTATLKADGTLESGWGATDTTTMGTFSALTAVTLGGGNLGVYAIGTDSQIYSGKFNASTGRQLGGWTLSKPGLFSTLAAQTNTAGRSLVLGVEKFDQSVSAALFDADGNYISGWMETGTGKFTKVAVAPRAK